MKIIIIIPAYNEENNIGAVLTELSQYPYHILVVDDGSTDTTADIVRTFPRVKLVQHMINRGMGAALQTGNEAALRLGVDIIVHFDADGQMLASEIEAMIGLITKGKADITLGSRFLSKKSNIPFFKEYFILKPARLVNWFFTGLWLTDAHSGWRAFTRDVAEKFQIKQDRMAHNTEIVHAINKFKLRYKEIPVTVVYNEFGQGVAGGLRIVKDLILSKFV
ncbi:glycosyltransferase family 2 protein [Patescibacteria group bacterium AH-259-L07]|nr:glycosyltransferase family 2 protein [Patescibacteria group bacterium AH-259-L07]